MSPGRPACAPGTGCGDAAPVARARPGTAAAAATTAQQRRRGFTLIELVAVTAIVGILASAALPLVQLTQRRSQEFELRRALRELRAGIDAYKRAYDDGRITPRVGASGYPPDLATLAAGVPDARSLDGRKLYFLRRVPRDPLADPELPADQTWALRSHDSPPDAPAPGEDVFDIASRAPGRALDGSRYQDW